MLNTTLFFLLARALNFTISEESSPVPAVNSTEFPLNTTTSTELSEGSQNATKGNTTYKVSCLVQTPPPDYIPTVEIVNSTQLLALMNVQVNVTSPQTPATCLLVFFYSPSCPFSCKAAPYYNAFARMCTGIKLVAVDTSSRHNFNAQYGIVGVPSLLLFHNGRPAARFNTSSDYNILSLFEFVVTQTGLLPHPFFDSTVTSADFIGPISSFPVKEVDYCLALSWIFIILCGIYFFYYSSWCQLLVDSVRNAWREAEAQHHHTD